MCVYVYWFGLVSVGHYLRTPRGVSSSKFVGGHRPIVRPSAIAGICNVPKKVNVSEAKGVGFDFNRAARGFVGEPVSVHFVFVGFVRRPVAFDGMSEYYLIELCKFFFILFVE